MSFSISGLSKPLGALHLLQTQPSFTHRPGVMVGGLASPGHSEIHVRLQLLPAEGLNFTHTHTYTPTHRVLALATCTDSVTMFLFTRVGRGVQGTVQGISGHGLEYSTSCATMCPLSTPVPCHQASRKGVLLAGQSVWWSQFQCLSVLGTGYACFCVPDLLLGHSYS